MGGEHRYDTPESIEKRRAGQQRRAREEKALRLKQPTMAPRCKCETPAPHTDLEDHTTCLLCGRTPR
jgi:hypothetical protein